MPPVLRFSSRLMVLLPALFLLQGCGYTLRTSRSQFVENAKIKTIFLSAVTNNSFKPGVDSVVFNAAVKMFSSSAILKMVHSEEQADVILNMVVLVADFGPVASRSVPIGKFAYQAATQYTARLQVAFGLFRRNPITGKGVPIWGTTLIREVSFAASAGSGVAGTTNALTNETEFDRALSEMAQGLMIDVQETMF
ncbi:hypothetical protein WDW86_05240 [Bdellovibrionota bacterium FG-2]